MKQIIDSQTGEIRDVPIKINSEVISKETSEKVLSNLWPKLIVANSTGPALFSAKNILLASPGKSIPVLFNNLNWFN